ncbi:MAG: 4Fe-4S binding protein [Oscillospiraceae bacterium]|nr:4Fe-4S binding protein [Oscillospiraceae bacterium]
MNITRICAVYFSPTGNNRKIARQILDRLAARLGAPKKLIDITLPKSREGRYEFEPSDLAIFVLPTYAGKLPNKLLPYMQSAFTGNGAPAVALVSFGNRAFENSLAELNATLAKDGFRPVSGGAFAAEHAFSPSIGTGRPNDADKAELDALADATADFIEKWDGSPVTLNVPGDADAPYYVPLGLDGLPKKFLPAKPNTDMSLCTNCKACVKLCPVGSINPDNVAETPGICIKCHACIRLCPFHAKFMDDENFLSHRGMLERDHTEPKPNFWAVAGKG